MKRLIATTHGALTTATVLVGCSSDATNSASANETQIIQSAFGETEIPINPQRIVIVQANFLDLALAIDLEPVGSTYWGGAGGIQDYLREDAPENMEVVGNDDEPNFEAIANLNPDLIIGDEAVEENLEKFEAIAPVAAIASRDAEGSNSWRDQLTALAEITGREDKAAEVIKEADESIEQLDANIDEPGQRTMLLRIRDDQVRQYLPDSFVGAGVPQRLQKHRVSGISSAVRKRRVVRYPSGKYRTSRCRPHYRIRRQSRALGGSRKQPFVEYPSCSRERVSLHQRKLHALDSHRPLSGIDRDFRS